MPDPRSIQSRCGSRVHRADAKDMGMPSPFVYAPCSVEAAFRFHSGTEHHNRGNKTKEAIGLDQRYKTREDVVSHHNGWQPSCYRAAARSAASVVSNGHR